MDVKKLLEDFIKQSKVGNLHTNQYPKKLSDLDLRVSFGQGGLAKRPWIAILGKGMEPREGYYPVYLYYKEDNILDLCYGRSETRDFPTPWSSDIRERFSDIPEDKKLKKEKRREFSWIYKTYIPKIENDQVKFFLNDQEISSEELLSDLSSLVEEYKKCLDDMDESLLTPQDSTKAPSMKDLIEVTNTSEEELDELNEILDEKKQIIIEGPPGTGKTFLAERFGRYLTKNPLEGPLKNHKRFKIVQFHQSYGYEDFIHGIRPETTEDGQLRYTLVDGVFKTMCEAAKKDSNNKFVIIVDEINRGSLSRIFGELMYLLEYRDKEIHLANSKEDDPLFKIPDNVYLIGTMNTTDRSIALIDYALRRRFNFHRLMPLSEPLSEDPEAPVLQKWLEKNDISKHDRDRLLKSFKGLNKALVDDLDEHHQIGHSYFMDRKTSLDKIWKRSIKPLLEEYFFGHKDLRDKLDKYNKFFDENLN